MVEKNRMDGFCFVRRQYWRFWFCGWLCFVGITFLSATARGETNEPWKNYINQSITEGYRHLYKTQTKNYPEALRSFFKATSKMDALSKDKLSSAQRFWIQRVRVSLFFLIGETYRAQSQPLQAAYFYRRCVQGDPKLKPKVKQHAYNHLKTLLKQVGATLKLETSPNTAQVEVSSPYGLIYKGNANTTLRLEPGVLTLSLSAAGYQTKTVTLREVYQGQTVERRFVLSKTPAVVAKRPEPRTDQGNVLQRTPPERRVAVNPRNPVVSRKAGVSTAHIVAWVMVGLGVAAAGGGTALFIVGKNQFEKYHGDSSFLGKNEEVAINAQRGAQTMQGLGIAAWGLAGACAVVAVVLFVIRPPAPPPVALVPVSGLPAASIVIPLRKNVQVIP